MKKAKLYIVLCFAGYAGYLLYRRRYGKKIGLVLASLLLIRGLYVLAYPALNGALIEHKAESAA